MRQICEEKKRQYWAKKLHGTGSEAGPSSRKAEEDAERQAEEQAGGSSISYMSDSNRNEGEGEEAMASRCRAGSSLF